MYSYPKRSFTQYANQAVAASEGTGWVSSIDPADDLLSLLAPPFSAVCPWSAVTWRPQNDCNKKTVARNSTIK